MGTEQGLEGFYGGWRGFMGVGGNFVGVEGTCLMRKRRVLCTMSMNFECGHLLQVHELKRTDVEKGLTFAGFLVVSCPLKEHTKHSVKCLQDSSHHVRLFLEDWGPVHGNKRGGQ